MITSKNMIVLSLLVVAFFPYHLLAALPTGEAEAEVLTLMGEGGLTDAEKAAALAGKAAGVSKELDSTFTVRFEGGRRNGIYIEQKIGEGRIKLHAFNLPEGVNFQSLKMKIEKVTTADGTVVPALRMWKDKEQIGFVAFKGEQALILKKSADYPKQAVTTAEGILYQTLAVPQRGSFAYFIRGGKLPVQAVYPNGTVKLPLNDHFPLSSLLLNKISVDPALRVGDRVFSQGAEREVIALSPDGKVALITQPPGASPLPFHVDELFLKSNNGDTPFYVGQFVTVNRTDGTIRGISHDGKRALIAVGKDLKEVPLAEVSARLENASSPAAAVQGSVSR